MPDTKQIISFLMIGLAGIDVLFCILALALNTWLDYYGFSSGLWKVCIVGQCVSIDDFGVIEGWLNEVRVFAFLGLFWMIITTVAAVLRTFLLKDKIIILYLIIGLSAVSGLCMMIAFAVYTNNTTHKYGAGFALCILAWILGWTVAGLGCFLLILNRNTS
ncbi:epithelial membrane protein 1-like [Dreissena polymorpha]|uniref:epithelial membrane protein 1-like n=1 Tax=Dreissena polymorpha TaxID=45954 RepID=UPI00226431D1|nr:epithelial membrane protein 1-like [Dreissena polymorpha]